MSILPSQRPPEGDANDDDDDHNDSHSHKPANQVDDEREDLIFRLHDQYEPDEDDDDDHESWGDEDDDDNDNDQSSPYASTTHDTDAHSPRAKKREWLLRMNRKLDDIAVGQLDPTAVPVTAVMNAWAKTRSAQGASMVEMWLQRAQKEYNVGNVAVVPTTKMYTMAGM